MGETAIKKIVLETGFLYEQRRCPETGTNGIIELRAPKSGAPPGVQVKSTDSGQYVRENDDSFEYLVRSDDLARILANLAQTGLASGAVPLLGRVAIRYPHLRNRAAYRLAGDARMIGLMHHGVLAMEHLMIRVHPLDPYAGFVAGDDFRRPQKGRRLVCRDPEPVARADEHAHQRAFADGKADTIAQQPAQPLVGKRVKVLQINRQRVNARPKRRRRGEGGRRGFCCDPTCRAVTGEACY